MANYPDPWVDDGKIWAYYDVNTTDSTTRLGSSNITRYNGMEIDGTAVTPVRDYQFSTLGIHLVKLDISGGQFQLTFNTASRLVRCYYPDNAVISNDDFSGVTSLTYFRFPENVAAIGARSFTGCTNLEIQNLRLPKLTSLNTGSFTRCRKIEIISDLGNITSIPGNYVFQECTSLKTVILPPTLTSLGTGAFEGCTNLKNVFCFSATPPTMANYVFRYDTLTAIYVPNQSLQAYKEASGWSSYANIIYPIWKEAPIAINHLSLGDFRRRIMLGISTPKPLYPDPYEDDGWIWCYYNVTTTESATQLVSSYVTDFGANFIIDGETVARTASYTFSTTGEHLVKMYKTGSCKNFWQNVKTLKRIYFPSVVTSFSSNSVFGGCTALTYVHLSDFSSISGQAFGSCSSLKKVNLQDTHITTTGSGSYGTFQNCTSLEKIALPLTVTSIGGASEFEGCTNLVKINLNSLPNLRTIANRAFLRAPLTGMELSLPSLTSIGSSAFSNTRIKRILNLGKVTVVAGASINGSFQNVTSLIEAIIPTSVGVFQQYCFNGDTALAKMTIEATTPPTIGSSALTRCPLTYIYVPGESVDDYKAINWSSYAARIYPIDDGWSLPDGYTAVPYVQTDSRAYIDTGIAGGVSTNWVRASFQWSTYIQGGAIYGNYVDDSHKACMALLNESTSLLVGVNTNLGQSCSGTAADTRTTIRATGTSAIIRGTQTNITAESSLTDNTANIFIGTNGPNHAVNDIGLRIYHFDIFDYANNVYLVRYIPCVRNSDNKAGLYDRQNNVFRPSDTAVDFIAGT